MRFWNRNQKIRFILEAISPGENVSLSELLRRLETRGYRGSRHELAMFIRNNLEHRYLKAERSKAGIKLYRRVL